MKIKRNPSAVFIAPPPRITVTSPPPSASNTVIIPNNENTQNAFPVDMLSFLFTTYYYFKFVFHPEFARLGE